jgi:hypothetical protein
LLSDVHVGEHSALRGCVIGNHVKIGNHTSIYEQAVIGSRCLLGHDVNIKSKIKIWPDKLIEPFISVFSFPLPPMLLALDRPDAPVAARLIGSVVFFLSIAPLCWQLGIIGAAISIVLGNVATVAVMVVQLQREYRRVRPPRLA